MNWTEDQLKEYWARIGRIDKLGDLGTPDPGPESKLQAKCLQFCKEHGYPVFHDWSRKRNMAGWPDLTIYMKNRVALVELKAAGGRLSSEQKRLRQKLLWLGHPYHVVRSYVGFLRAIKGE
jgi:hypothetical protein